MKRNALVLTAAAAMIVFGASAGGAADRGAVTSLSDLDGGAGNYHYIYPHVGADKPATNSYTSVPSLHPAPNVAPLPQQADVPLDRPAPKTAAARSDAQH